MEFGGDADVGMLQNVSTLRIGRGSATSGLVPTPDILLRHDICRCGPIGDLGPVVSLFR